MAIRDVFKITRKTFINPAGWVDYGTIKSQTRTLWEVLKAAVTPDKPTREETFEQACQRLHLNEADIAEMIKVYRFYALLFLIFGVMVLAYTLYLLFTHPTIGALVLGIASSALFLSQAFRYDFWAYQMRIRRLGVSVGEWKQQLFAVKGKKP